MHATTGSLPRRLPGERRAANVVVSRADASYGCVDWYCYDAPLPANSQQLGVSPGPGALHETTLEVKSAHGA